MSDLIRIFISHGAPQENSDARAYKIRTALKALLDAGTAAPNGDVLQWDPFMDDKCVEPSEQWRPKIFEALARCQAAVVLLDPRARSRPWVINEFLILLFRKYFAKKEFPLLVVDIQDASVENALSDDEKQNAARFQALLEPLQENEYQRLRDQAAGQPKPEGDLLAEIASEVSKGPFPAIEENAWVKQTANLLGELANNAELKKQLVDAMVKGGQIAPEQLPGGDDLLCSLATSLYSLPVQQSQPLLKTIGPAVRSRNLEDELIAWLHPLWVDHDLARPIHPALSNAWSGQSRLFTLSVPKVADDAQMSVSCAVLHRAGFDFPRELRLLTVLATDVLEGSDRITAAKRIVGRLLAKARHLDVQLKQLEDAGTDAVAVQQAARAIDARIQHYQNEQNFQMVFLAPDVWHDADLLKGVLGDFQHLFVMAYSNDPLAQIEARLAGADPVALRTVSEANLDARSGTLQILDDNLKKPALGRFGMPLMTG